MADDIRAAVSMRMPSITINLNDLEGFVLYEIQILLSNHSKNVSNFGLPTIPQQLLDDLHNRLIMEEKNYDHEALMAEKSVLVSNLNERQKIVYDTIIASNNEQKQELIFVYGHGKIVLAVASSGTASLLLASGQTAHSRFRIPIDITDESGCNIKKKTHLATLLRMTELIIWDVVPMNDLKCLEALDRTLRDIFDNPKVPFGGLTFVLGRDFCQTLPVKRGCGKS
ncbi:uncharacterized protein [Rutidosis leptorrhynchoides]|uniref:uncharacterized protein n=1 Tax=Rutidosis leptorrhynchoides TaxID=125765 RepID=UPI003A99366E